MKKKLLTISIFFVAMALVHEIEKVYPSAHAITRQEAVQYALENAENIRIVRQAAQQVRETGKQSVAFLKPQVNLIGGYSKLGTNAPDIPIPELQYPDRDLLAQAELSQLLYAGGRIWKSLALEKNLYKQADQQEISGIRDIVKAVKSAFDSVLYQKAGVEILKDRFLQRQRELEDAQRLWEVGMVTFLDVRQARLNLNFAYDSLKEMETAHMDALIDFNLALGRSMDEQLLNPESTLDKLDSLDGMIQSLYDFVDGDAFVDIELRKTEMETARLNHEVARGGYYPEFLLFSTAATRGESRSDMDESWSVGLHMRWHFSDGGLTRSRTAEAASRLISARENLKKTRKNLYGRVEQIALNHETLKQRKKNQQEAVKLAEENYEDAREQYLAGTITLTTLGEFNLRFAEARFNLIGIYFLERQLLIETEALLEKDAL
jgi:outer membrane protein TolC